LSKKKWSFERNYQEFDSWQSTTAPKALRKPTGRGHQGGAPRELAVKSFLAGEEDFFLRLAQDFVGRFDVQTDLLN